MTSLGENSGMRQPTMVMDEPPLSSEDEVISEDDQEPEKDATEEELERLVFGNTAGFRDELKSFKQIARLGEEGAISDDEQEDQNALTTVDSADLFFLDSGPADLQQRSLIHTGEDAEDDREQGRDPPAWEDSDDDRLQVSLMAVPRLRKLRLFEGEDVISGKEYQRRLRKQFELLNPRPQWATWTPSQRSHRKRRRGSNDEDLSGEDNSSSEDDDDDNNNDMEDDDFSTQPLAKLLRSTETLTRSSQTLPNKRIKLRTEAISIERLKDIGPTQPSAITSLSIHPTFPLLLSSGPSSTLYLHRLQPHPTPPDPANPLITSLHLKHTPLTTTAFSASVPFPDQQQKNQHATQPPKIYLSSRRRYFHIWDLPTGQISKITRVYGHQDTQRSMETLKPSPCGRYIALQGSTRKGDSGVINVLDAATAQWAAQVRVESRKGVAGFAWWGNGEGLCIVGRGGEVSEWSVAERRIVARWQDEGAVGITTLALGGTIAAAAAGTGGKKNSSTSLHLGSDRWIAIGSTSGIVNIYDRSSWSSTSSPLLLQTSTSTTPTTNSSPAISTSTPITPPTPTPTKTLSNLTTPISHLVFSPCGQLLAMSSRWKRDALRLVHMPSCSVYRNWPTGRTPLGRVSAVALGEYDDGGGEGKGTGQKVMVLAVGNEAGVLRAWEIMG